MPYYQFRCKNNHSQELQISFDEHERLDIENGHTYIECDVKYGDKKHPHCELRAYQVFDKNIGIILQ